MLLADDSSAQIAGTLCGRRVRVKASDTASEQDGAGRLVAAFRGGRRRDRPRRREQGGQRTSRAAVPSARLRTARQARGGARRRGGLGSDHQRSGIVFVEQAGRMTALDAPAWTAAGGGARSRPDRAPAPQRTRTPSPSSTPRPAHGSRVAIGGPPTAPSATRHDPPLRRQGLHHRRADRERLAPGASGRVRRHRPRPGEQCSSVDRSNPNGMDALVPDARPWGR